MQIRQIVDRYLALAGNFGRSVPLEKFALDAQATENIFSALDEDYHISRYFHFTSGEGKSYNIGGEPCTHVSIDAAIREIL